MGNKSFFYELSSDFLNTNPDAVAFHVYDGKKVSDISYVQFYKDIVKAAGYFRSKKIYSQHIALIAHNCYEYLVALFAINISGNTIVLQNPDIPRDVMLGQFRNADATIACIEDVLLPCLQDHMACITFSNLMSDEHSPIDVFCDHSPDDTVVLMLSSGTTGKNKIVEFSDQNIRARIEDIMENDAILKEGSEMVVLPFYHLSGLQQLFFLLYTHRIICLGRGMRYFLFDLPILNPRVISLVPVALDSLAKIIKKTHTSEIQKKVIGFALTHISVGGAQSNNKTCEFMMEQGFSIQMGYGMTETNGAGTFCILKPSKVNSIGKPYGHTQMRIKNGELQIKSPAIMKGYYKDPEETAKVIVDGWLHTGDMGYCDEDGYYYITGRKKNVIILSNGENVNPEEIEATFGICDAIEESLVYSDGKGICADVFTKDRDVAAAYIKQYNGNMPLYRQVYKVNYTEEPLPKTGSGKIKRKENK